MKREKKKWKTNENNPQPKQINRPKPTQLELKREQKKMKEITEIKVT